MIDIESLGELVFDSGVSSSGAVVVIIPLYNYGNYIAECLSSVAAQTLDQLSVIVVDDGSTDGGLTLAEKFLREHAARFCSARVVRHKRNHGPSMTRNSGVAWSSEPLLFMLDADNRIRPPALARLKTALEVDGADFAYSQLFIFGNEISVGVADVWHVDRLRHGNTIDAMAMIRRCSLIKAGGYKVLADDHGWEDYDLWCRFYTLGMRGVFLPELLCEYRRHGRSREDLQVKEKCATLEAEMLIRYPEIFNREARMPEEDEDFSIALPLGYPVQEIKSAPKIASIIHMFAEQLCDEFLSYLSNIPYPSDIFISTDTDAKKDYIQERIRHFKGAVEIRVTPRQGRDIAPRLIGFRDIYDRYDYVLLLHSKVSSHSHLLENWRAHLLENLIGSSEIVDSILELFFRLPELGIVAAQHFEPVRQWLGWGENFDRCRALAERIGVDLRVNGFIDYPSGSMLWARTAALRPLLDPNLVLEDFSPDAEGRQIDGTMAHAVERLFFVAAEKAGYSWVKAAQPHLFERKYTIKEISSPAELRKFVAGQRRILCVGRSSRPVLSQTSDSAATTGDL